MTTLTLERLGYGPHDRIVIVHQDDVGMCHGANLAFLELSQRGLVTCGSVMAPCPWFLETAALAREHPELDLGVHLTLTAEWRHYRWGPLSTRDPASGLLDEEGCFWRRTPQVQAHLNVAAAAAEFRAQIERALAAGIDVTHLDTHMGAALLPELLPVYLALGREYRLPVLALRRPDAYAQALGLGSLAMAGLDELVAGLEQAGMPVVDHFAISPFAPDRRGEAAYRDMFAALPAGLTFFSLHPNAPGDIETIIPERAHYRVEEHQLLQAPGFVRFVAEQGLHTAGYRRLRDLMRKANGQ